MRVWWVGKICAPSIHWLVSEFIFSSFTNFVFLFPPSLSFPPSLCFPLYSSYFVNTYTYTNFTHLRISYIFV